MPYLLYLVFGLGIGGLVGWFLAASKFSKKLGALEQKAIYSEAIKSDLERKENEIKSLQEALNLTRLEYEKEKAALQSEFNALKKAREDLGKEFESLALKIFEDRSGKFAAENRTQLIDLLEPFRRQVEDFRNRVDTIYKEDNNERVRLIAQIEQLSDLNQRISKEATNLTLALKGDSKARGNWGELVIERVFQLSGLEKDREYVSQKYLKNRYGGDERRFPDFIVHFPGDRDVVVDVKTVLKNYEEYCSAEDEVTRAEALKKHIASVRTQMKELSAKKYHELEGINPLEQVIMCIPNESAYIVAVKEDPKLAEDSIKNGILIVGPNTLLLTLQIIAAIWKSEEQKRNVREVVDRGKLLYEKFVGFLENMEEVSKAIDNARQACDSARNKLSQGSGNLVSQAEKLIALGITSSKKIPASLDKAL